jgi:hypothetical protein
VSERIAVDAVAKQGERRVRRPSGLLERVPLSPPEFSRLGVFGRHLLR